MRPPEIRPFSEEHLDDAARLLAARHRRHREAEPLLPAAFEDPAAAREEVAALWDAGASGYGSFRDGRMGGYLLGIERDRELWGGNVWVDYAGHAFDEPEDARDAYAAAAADWVSEDRTNHFVQVPASDTGLVQSWFRLCFGQMQSDGIREVPPQTDTRVPEGVEVRRPEPGDDIEALIEVDLALPRHHRSSPVFTRRPVPSEDVLRAEWAKVFTSDEETVLAAFRDGRPVALWALTDPTYTPEFRGLHAPERACYLKFAATLPDARGSGVGVALMDTSLAWAAGQGYTAIATDWRVTNLLASRFWPRRGFRPTFYRLYRHVP